MKLKYYLFIPVGIYITYKFFKPDVAEDIHKKRNGKEYKTYYEAEADGVKVSLERYIMEADRWKK